MQADVRKKVLWGQWAECALAGARNRHGWEMLRTNGGDDERAVAINCCQQRAAIWIPEDLWGELGR